VSNNKYDLCLCGEVSMEEHKRGKETEREGERGSKVIREAMPNQQKKLNNFDLLHVFRDLLARQVSSRFVWLFVCC